VTINLRMRSIAWGRLGKVFIFTCNSIDIGNLPVPRLNTGDTLIHRDRLIITVPHVNHPFSRISMFSSSRAIAHARFRPADFAAPERLTAKNGTSGALRAHECHALSQSCGIPPTWAGLSGAAHVFTSPRFTPDAPSAPQARRSGRSSGFVRRRGLPNRPPAFAVPRSCASDRSARGDA